MNDLKNCTVSKEKILEWANENKRMFQWYKPHGSISFGIKLDSLIVFLNSLVSEDEGIDAMKEYMEKQGWKFTKESKNECETNA